MSKRKVRCDRCLVLERIECENEYLDWRPIDNDTPRSPDVEIMLYYREWCGIFDFIVSGHWHCVKGREYEATWEHSCGYGDADMWAPIRKPPKKFCIVSGGDE